MKVADYVRQLERVASLVKSVAEETDEDTLQVDPVRWGMLMKALEHLETIECNILTR